MRTQKAVSAARRAVSLCLLMQLMGFAPRHGWAQSGAVCGPSPAVKLALDGLPEQTPAQTERQAYEQRSAVIQALLRQYPGDVFVEKAYINFANDLSHKAKLIAEYKARHDQNPDDAKVDYLFALALVGRQSPEAIRLLTDALKKDPNFAPPHLELASIYSTPVFMDKGQRVAHLKDYLEACPSSFEGYESLTRIDDKDLQRTYAARLRSLIGNRTDPDAVAAYATLWSLEFKAHAPSEYAPLRKQVDQDLERIRELKLENKRQWYEALVEGYKLVNDQKQSDVVSDQEQARFPSPWSAPGAAKWWKEHKYPGEDAPPDKIRAYYQDVLQQSAQWVRDRPNTTYVWMKRLDAVEHLDGAPLADVKTAIDETVRVMESNLEPHTLGSPYDRLNVAEVLAVKRLEPECEVEMAQKAFDQLEKEAQEPYYDLWATKENVDQNKFDLAYYRLQALGFEADGYLQLRQADKAHLLLAQMDERLDDLKAQVGDNQRHKKSYGRRLADYWGLMGREAELRGRKLDAMGFYENALLARLDAEQKLEPGIKDELADNAHQLWVGLGGSDEGWKLWYGRRADALANLAALTWEDANQPLPTFELADLSGKTWNMASLKGKTTFLNFWASW